VVNSVPIQKSKIVLSNVFGSQAFIFSDWMVHSIQNNNEIKLIFFLLFIAQDNGLN
jgi:hypothetical protein